MSEARKAVADAGLKKSAIDAVLSGHAFASPFHGFSVAQGQDDANDEI